MHLISLKKGNIAFAVIVAVLIITISAYAGDHMGDYLSDQAPSKYYEPATWRVYVGYVMLALVFLYMGRQIWKDLKERLGK